MSNFVNIWVFRCPAGIRYPDEARPTDDTDSGKARASQAGDKSEAYNILASH